MTSNEYMHKYMLARYRRKRKEAIALLGGKCAACGSTTKLEFDHIDIRTKSFNISKAWSYSKARLDAELAKCQLLCSECHDKKTLADLGVTSAKGKHGTLSSYRYCKCVLCKKAKADYMREYNKR